VALLQSRIYFYLCPPRRKPNAGEMPQQVSGAGNWKLASPEPFSIFQAVESILAKALGQDSGQTAVAEKRDLLERLLARLAHEIRNPLSSLDIHVQLLEEDLAGLVPAMHGKLAPRLEIIRGELHRLEGIVDQFLRLAGPSELDVETVEVAKIVNHVCDLLRPEAAAREIEVMTQIEPALPCIVGDPVRLTQALMNLVINAMQAVERNGRIAVNANLVEAVILVKVADNGPGIPQEKLASIFDPYFTTKSEGNGLGLWIAQQIVTAHGGSIQAQNGTGGGAVFTMALPLKKEPVSCG
jgi:two-component system sensor histidine kinase HydH